MKDTWDVLILFLIAAIVAGLMYICAITLFKQSFQKDEHTTNSTSRLIADDQTRQAEDTRRQQEQMLRDQRIRQEQMMRDTRQKIQDMKRR